jgi:hypothetical protein
MVDSPSISAVVRNNVAVVRATTFCVLHFTPPSRTKDVRRGFADESLLRNMFIDLPWGAVMFYSAALVPYVSVGKPITKVTYKQTPRKHPCLLQLTIECALYCRQSEEAFINEQKHKPEANASSSG